MLDTVWRKKYWQRYQELEAFSDLLKKINLPKAAEKKSFLIQSSQNPFKIVFVDGFISIEHSNLPGSVVCLPLAEAMRSYGIFLQNQMNRTIHEETDLMAALNGANYGEGAFIYIPPKLELAIHVEHYFTTSDLVSPRLVFSLGKHSSVSLHQDWKLQDHFVNAHNETILDAGASLQIKNVQKESQSTIFHSFRASLKRDAQLTYRQYSEGSCFSRYSIKVQLQEENSAALIQGLGNLDQSAQNCVQTTVEHLAPHTQSRQHFKALLKGKSHSSFEGKIFVHSIAQKTQGYQLSNNLLLSDTATVDVKPNLEIFADDVKASHGATLGQLDEEALFYLTSRGIPKEVAKQYLIQGFVQELQECLP